MKEKEKVMGKGGIGTHGVADERYPDLVNSLQEGELVFVLLQDDTQEYLVHVESGTKTKLFGHSIPNIKKDSSYVGIPIGAIRAITKDSMKIFGLYEKLYKEHDELRLQLKRLRSCANDITNSIWEIGD